MTAPHVPALPPVPAPHQVPVPHQVPGPPPGPGVQPPFPAPPVEGKGKRLGMSLGITAGVAVLICGGGGAALVGLGVSMQSSLRERAHVAVDAYFVAVEQKQYEKAYRMLCERAQDRETPAEYRIRIGQEPPIRSHATGEFDVVAQTVPVTLTYADGDTGEVEAQLSQNQDTGEYEVCDVSE